MKTVLTTLEPSLQEVETLRDYCETSTRFLGSFEAFVERHHRLAVRDVLSSEWKISELSQNEAFLQRILTCLKPYAPLEKPTQFLALVEPSWN